MVASWSMNIHYRHKDCNLDVELAIEREIIDLLQGRISNSVLVNHYYRPDINELITKRIRPVFNKLQRELLS
jgi:intergrase/recombinase